MRYLLDTNVCVDAMRGRREVVKKLLSLSPDDCGISTISVFELEAGARKSNHPEQELRKVRAMADTLVVYSWNYEAAQEAARIRAELETSGMKIGAYDTLISGHATALGLTLVTDNTGEFSRVARLNLENWRE
jgi:tRNA(fMet)-specific endonuclease VapC